MFISIIWNCNFTIIMSKLLIAELSWCNVSLIVVQFQLKPSQISFSSSGFIPIYSKFPQIPMNEQCNQVQSCFSVILWSYSYSCNHFRSIVKPTRVMWGDTRASVWRRKLGKTAIVDSNDGNDSSGGTAQCDRKPESRLGLVNPAQWAAPDQRAGVRLGDVGTRIVWIR